MRPRNHKSVQNEFWLERWRTSQIGFHQSTVDRTLEAHWPSLKVAAHGSVFAPLCGKSLDLLWLRDRGHEVRGVEISGIAVEAFCMENGIPARRAARSEFDVFESDRLRLFCGDFFALTPKLLGDVAAVYDRAALISWVPEMRARYAEHMAALTSQGAQTLLIAVEYPQAQMPGPPFAVTEDQIDKLYARHHSIEKLARRDILEIEARLRARGLTELHEVCYRLTRK
jgi:thiopurine S-methyltransferase